MAVHRPVQWWEAPLGHRSPREEVGQEHREKGDRSRRVMGNPTLAPQLEKTHETPPSSREEGHL